MDVELLRPGTVPIAPDTVLWFEFLLNKDLLLPHLQKPNPEPSPTELITKFSSGLLEAIKNEPKKDMEEDEFSNLVLLEEKKYYRLKARALKILIFKVSAFLKWNLDTIRTLPLKVQVTMFQDLLCFTNYNKTVELPNIPDIKTMESPKDPFLFTLILYHRWVIISCMGGPSYKVNSGPRNVNEILLVETRQLHESLFSLENADKSLEFLNEVLTWKTLPKMLAFNCFFMLSEENKRGEFDHSFAIEVSKEEYFAQLHFEIAAFNFFKEHYDVASTHFMTSMDYYKKIENPVGFMTLTLPVLDTYLLACNSRGKNQKNTLLHQLRASVTLQFTGILNILLQDNIKKEIPIVHRINIELDIIAAISSGKFTVARDLLPKVQALNMLRYILDETAVQYNENEFNVDAFVWALSSVWQHCNEREKNLIIDYLVELIINDKTKDIILKINNQQLQEIVNHPVIKEATETLQDNIAVPQLLETIQWELYESNKKRNPFLEIKILEQQIVQSYDPKELKELLVKLTSKDAARPNWKINVHWSLPIPLQSVIMSINRGFWQDYSYILLAKSRELMQRKDWKSAIDLLQVLEADVQSNSNSAMNKLSKLIGWEKLLIQINQLLEEWPAPEVDKPALIASCEQCLKTNDLVLPRTEIMEQSLVCLLNLNYWDIANCIEKRWSNFEISIAITLACQDIVKSKGSKKYAKELWDMVLPIFTSNLSKRSGMGGSGGIHHDSPLSNDRAAILSHFSKLRDSVVLSVVISMLTKLYNILKDEASLELNIENLTIWPVVLSNANSYNIWAVFDVLSQLVTQGLQYYPTNCSWLRLMGDINFANFKYEKALGYYLKFLMISTDHFNLLIKPDDVLFRRMIKCSLVLGCNTQVAILSQFLEEPDYLLAFRSLAESKCNDSIDAYYHCFWDTNILEYLVHMHHKKAEIRRRRKAVQAMGLLELNASNNEEIQRESNALRKKDFLTALCKQYVSFA